MCHPAGGNVRSKSCATGAVHWPHAGSLNMAIQTAKPIQWGRVIRRGVGCYALILFWEFATIPAMSHSNASWRGVGLSVLALPVGTYFLLHAGARAATCFVYVCGA